MRRSCAQREPHVAAVAALDVAFDRHRLAGGSGPRAAAAVRPSRRSPGCPPRLLGGDRSRRTDLELETERERIVGAPWSSTPPACTRTTSRQMLGGETFTIYPARGEYAELAPDRRSLLNGAGLSGSRTSPGTASASTWCRRSTARCWWVRRSATRRGRRTTNPIGCRSRSSSKPRRACCRGSRLAGSAARAAAASARSCARRIRRSPTS